MKFSIVATNHNENSFRRSKRDPKLFTFSERFVGQFWRGSWLKRKQPFRESSREGSCNEIQFFCLCSGEVCVVYRLVNFNSQSIHISWLSRTNIADIRITLPWGHHGQFIDWWKRHFPSPAYFSNRVWRLHCTGHESMTSALLGVTEISSAPLPFVRFLETGDTLRCARLLTCHYHLSCFVCAIWVASNITEFWKFLSLFKVKLFYEFV